MFLVLSVLAVPLAAIISSIRHYMLPFGFPRLFCCGEKPWYTEILSVFAFDRDDLSTVWILISMLSFIVALCGTAVVQLRLRAAIARERQYREGGGYS